MIEDIQQIKTVRKKLNLTQNQFAKEIGISQSLIAKIEAGRIDPSFSKAKQIFQAIDRLSSKQETKANEIMTKSIISVTPGESIKNAIAKMKKHDVSQLPVIEHHKSIGIVSEAIILEAMMNNQGTSIREIMNDSAPVISKNTSLPAISNLLRFSSLVLVSDNGELKGIITKSDLLGKLIN